MTRAQFETQSSLRRLNFHNSTGSYFQQHISPALCQSHCQPNEIYYRLIYAVQRSGFSYFFFLGCQHSAHSRIYALTRVQVHYTRYCICIRSKKLLLGTIQTALYKVMGLGFFSFYCLQNLNIFSECWGVNKNITKLFKFGFVFLKTQLHVYARYKYSTRIAALCSNILLTFKCNWTLKNSVMSFISYYSFYVFDRRSDFCRISVWYSSCLGKFATEVKKKKNHAFYFDFYFSCRYEYKEKSIKLPLLI